MRICKSDEKEEVGGVPQSGGERKGNGSGGRTCGGWRFRFEWGGGGAGEQQSRIQCRIYQASNQGHTDGNAVERERFVVSLLVAYCCCNKAMMHDMHESYLAQKTSQLRCTHTHAPPCQ